MHELSVALGILDGVCEAAEQHGGGAVTAVHLEVGRLSGVVPGYLRSAWELAREGSICAGSELVIAEVPITVDCNVCGGEREVVSLQEMTCQSCGTPSAAVVRGRELLVVGFELEPVGASEEELNV